MSIVLIQLLPTTNSDQTALLPIRACHFPGHLRRNPSLPALGTDVVEGLSDVILITMDEQGMQGLRKLQYSLHILMYRLGLATHEEQRCEVSMEELSVKDENLRVRESSPHKSLPVGIAAGHELICRQIEPRCFQ